nr:hypothetical protein [Tanacetum cinerariifolium]
MSPQSSLLPQMKELVLNQGFYMRKRIDWIDSDEDEGKKDDIDDDKSIDLEMTDDEEMDDEFVHGFGDQFLKLTSDTSLIGTVKDTTDTKIYSLLDIKIQSEVPHIQSPYPLQQLFYPPPSVSTIPPVLHQTTTPIHAPPFTTEASTITIVVPESDALTIFQLRVAKLEKGVFELKKIDHSVEALATLKSKIGDDLQKCASDIRKIKREQAERQKIPKYTIKSTDKATLKEYDQKSTLCQTMNENKSFNRNHANHASYHALMEALREDENDMDKGVVDTVM